MRKIFNEQITTGNGAKVSKNYIERSFIIELSIPNTAHKQIEQGPDHPYKQDVAHVPNHSSH